MFLANILLTIGIAVQSGVIALLVWRRIYRSLPVFFFYLVSGLAGDGAVLVLRLAHSHNLYPFEIATYIDSLIQYFVLIELAWAILRPIQHLLPKGFLIGISVIVAASVMLAWPLSASKEALEVPRHLLLALHAQRSFAILRVLFLLILVFCSQFLRIGWRDRELQVATGLGFYSLVSLAGAMLHSHQMFGWDYFYVDVVVACSYLLALAYWTISFVRQETPRREMKPEAREFLVGIATAASQQRGRLAVVKSTQANRIDLSELDGDCL